LSNDSDEPFLIDAPASSRDDIDMWLSKVKVKSRRNTTDELDDVVSFQARLAWLKQELEIRQQLESKLRHELASHLLDSEADRKYFASELAKREVLIDELAREKDSRYSSSLHGVFKRSSRFRLSILSTRNNRQNETTSGEKSRVELPLNNVVSLDEIGQSRRTFGERNRTYAAIANNRNAARM
jgi:hypothetical protein